MRTYFESLESQILSPIAVKSAESKGRQFEEAPAENRTCFQRDRDRIIHSKAFRRLKHKTQVFIALESDHYRSRLTHTLEVAQISRHLARLLRLNEDLAEAIALAHDLGHTPFGHAGEKSLNGLMAEWGGFEHNQQSLRIVEVLETKYPHFVGLNLSYEIREGLKKHVTAWDRPKEDGKFVSLEAEVANLADEIAYNNHDIDDGLSAGILTDETLCEHVELWREAKKKIKSQYQDLSDSELKYLINSYLISTQIDDVIRTTEQAIQSAGVHSVADLQQLRRPLVSFGPEMKEKNKALRKHLFNQFYSHPSVYRMNKRGQHVIEQLFKAFQTDAKLLGEKYRQKVRVSQAAAENARVVADYIAGMTDNYALKEYKALFY